ncbi:MAG: nitrite/sulfite reductase, partial [Acidobacteriota bacterium]
MKPPELIRPNLKTRIEDFSREERAKLESDGLHGNLFEEFRDRQTSTIAWESQQIAKSHGIYLQWNRARTGQEKDWRYMIRFAIPGGGPLCPAQWRILDDLSDRYTANPDGFPSLRITTRQNLQFHWVRKEQVVEIVGRAAESGLFTLNGCGDNVRNIMACPLSRFSSAFNATTWAHLAADYFRLPGGAAIEIFAIDPAYLRDPQERFSYAPNLLNRKFKIAFSAIHWDGTRRTLVPDNCVEIRTNDIGVAPLVPHGEDGQVDRFQIYIGGGQGEKNGKPTFSALGEPFGIVGKDD